MVRPTRFQNKEMKGGGGTGVVCGSCCRPRHGGEEEEEVEEVAAATAEESLAEGRPRGSGRCARAPDQRLLEKWSGGRGGRRRRD